MKTLRRFLLIPVVAIAIAMTGDAPEAKADGFAFSVGGGRGISVASGNFWGPSVVRGYRGFGPGFGHGFGPVYRSGFYGFGPTISISRGYRGYVPAYRGIHSVPRYRSYYGPTYRRGCAY